MGVILPLTPLPPRTTIYLTEVTSFQEADEVAEWVKANLIPKDTEAWVSCVPSRDNHLIYELRVEYFIPSLGDKGVSAPDDVH